MITDDVDLRSLYRSKVVVNQDSQNNQPLQAEITLKPLTELKEGGILTISDKALEHSTVGEFTSLGDPNKPPSEKNGGRMRGGGHSQAGIEELERRGIKYRIEKTLKNGVRVGGVELHKTAEKQIGKCGQSWFPIDWTEQDVRDAGTYVLNHPRLRTKLIRGGVTFGYEYAQEYRGVTVLVRASNQNEASTIYPDGKQRAVDGGDWDGFESCTEPYRVDEVVR